MLHTAKSLYFTTALKKGEKALANRPMLDKRIEIINTDHFVPKKNKIVQNKNQTPPEAGGSPSEMKIRKTPTVGRTSTTRRTGLARKKSPAVRKGTASMPSEAGTMARPSDEEIRMRAYFISERRRRFALPGDADSDWIEAKRQLVSEAGRR